MRSQKTGLMCLLVLFLSVTRAATPSYLPDRPDSLPASRVKAASPVLQFVYTSDVHFGITRHQFDGDSNVTSDIVNARMVAKINSLPSLVLPADKGVNAGQPVGPVDYLVESGDIANRQEVPYQSATVSWQQFSRVYLHGVTLKDSRGQPAEFLLTPGNHDVSNAIGYYKKMQPATDPASMVGIYNAMLHPANPKTDITYHYPADKINYSKDLGGIHWMFINIWPDSANRIWMEKDLSSISAGTPVIIVTHDPPDGDAAHFINPNGAHDINAKDRFENLLEEHSKDLQANADAHPASPTMPAPPEAHAAKKPGSSDHSSAVPQPAPDAKPQTDNIEQAGFVAFLKAHPNIKAYFHGHNNWNEFYTYTGPAHDIALPVFRVDSPMKGKYSSKDETRLSFQLITIDTAARTMTVRECLWNTDPAHPDTPPSWGDSRTIKL